MQTVVDAGEQLSAVFYKKIESGDKFPSQAKLEAILSALGSDLGELEALLETKPWQHEPAAPPPGSAAPQAVRRALPEEYRAAAAAALGEGVWSSNVEVSSEQADREAQGRVAELVNHFLHLSVAEQNELLSKVRKQRFRR